MKRFAYTLSGRIDSGVAFAGNVPVRVSNLGLEARSRGNRTDFATIKEAPTTCRVKRTQCSQCKLERSTYSERDVRRAVIALAGATLLATNILTVPDAGAYGLEDGRLAKCRGDAPCVSTSSVGNPSKFGPPWSYQPETGDASIAWASLKRAIAENIDGGTIVESLDGPNDYYLRAEFPSTWRGIDDVEFRLIKSDSLVTYRSASREAIFIYPLQTPINTNKNKKRLEDIRSALGWEEFAGNELYNRDK